MNTLASSAILAILTISTCALTLTPTSVRAQAMTTSTAEYEPHLDAGSFTSAVTNPYFPLVPGTRFRFRGTGTSSNEVTVTEVTAQSRMIMGIRATVVHDQVFDRGELIEDTYDWYAQDSAGTVWYLGEQTRSLRHGRAVSTAGSWEYGANGAKPGVVMWADPATHLGEAYRQEYRAGVAEDMGKVLAVQVSVTVPYGTFADCVETEDTTPLEPKVLEHKYYCRGVGLVREAETAGAGGALVAVERVPRSSVRTGQK